MKHNYKSRKRPRGTFWKHVFSVFIASGLAKTMVAPLERIKLLLQVQSMLPQQQKFQNSLSFIYDVYKQQKIHSFWRGNYFNVLRTVPNAAMRFTLYDKFKQYSLPYSKQIGYFHEFFGRLAAASSTAVFSWCFNYPLDVIRVRLTCDMTPFRAVKPYKGAFDCAQKIYKNEGFAGFYKGFGISSLGIVPYISISFAAYDTFKSLIPAEISQKKGIYALQLVGLGSLSGMIGQLAAYPLDTVRRRMQINGQLGTVKIYSSVVDCMKKMYTQEGLRYFYRGIVPALVKVLPAATIQFSIYDYMKEFIFE